MTVSISKSRLISHRFRGFSEYENTIAGLNGAMDAGALYLECDIRVTDDGVPVIYHDQSAPDKAGQHHFIHKSRFNTLKSLGGVCEHIPTLEGLLTAFATHPHKPAILMLDIKVGGFEDLIRSAVHMTGCTGRVFYVSWVADALYAMHRLEPEVPLIFSHWAALKAPDNLHDVYIARSGDIPDGTMTNLHGGRHAWLVSKPIRGTMLEMLKKTKGGICIPKDMMSPELAAYYTSHGLLTSTFSWIDGYKITNDMNTFHTDLYFADTHELFR